jgi:transposase
MNLAVEPADHGIGRSRGGLSTKIHQLVDGAGMPLVVLTAPGQAGDAPMFPILMSHLRVASSAPGRPRVRPDKVRGDKAYSSKAIRELLRSKGVTAVIPQPDDQVAHRKRRGSAGGRPPAFDAEDYTGRNVVERGFQRCKQWRGIATRYDQTQPQLPRRCRPPRHHHLAQTVMGHALVPGVVILSPEKLEKMGVQISRIPVACSVVRFRWGRGTRRRGRAFPGLPVGERLLQPGR